MENLTNASEARLIATYKNRILDIAESVTYETFIFLRQYYALPTEAIGTNASFNKFLFNIVDDLHNIPSYLRSESIGGLCYELIMLRNNLDRYIKDLSCGYQVVDSVNTYISQIKASLNRLPKEAEEISCYQNY